MGAANGACQLQKHTDNSYCGVWHSVHGALNTGMRPSLDWGVGFAQITWEELVNFRGNASNQYARTLCQASIPTLGKFTLGV